MIATRCRQASFASDPIGNPKRKIALLSRYYFDVHDGKDIRDDEGMECASLAIVRREAVRAAGSILQDEAETWDGKPWKMEVRDKSGKIVAKLTFTAE